MRLWLVVCLLWVGVTGLDALERWATQRVSPVPDMLQDDTRAWLWINDPLWVSERLDRFARLSGVDMAPVRGRLVRAAYLINDLDGIDLGRPALMVWRDGASPLAAVIPIADRDTFLHHFGSVRLPEGPLVRVGERDGTVIFSQNTDQGLWEYRLLIGERSAYLARTPAECRALAAARSLRHDEDLPAVLGQMDSGRLLDEAEGLLTDAGLPTAPLRANIGSLRWALVQSGRDLRLAFHAVTVPGSPFARWLQRQDPQGSRLLTRLAGDQDILRAYSHLEWEPGFFADFADQALLRLAAAGLPELSDVRRQALQSFFLALETMRSTAWTLTLPARVTGDMDAEIRLAAEASRAIEVVSSAHVLGRWLSEADSGSAVSELDIDGSGRARFHWNGGSGGTNLVAGGDASTVILASGKRSTDRLQDWVGDFFAGLSSQVPPSGEPALVHVDLLLHQLAETARVQAGLTHEELPDATVSCTLSASDTGLRIAIDIPDERLAQTIRAADGVGMLD